MASPIERYRAREPKMIENAHRDGPPPEPNASRTTKRTRHDPKGFAGEVS